LYIKLSAAEVTDQENELTGNEVFNMRDVNAHL